MAPVGPGVVAGLRNARVAPMGQDQDAPASERVNAREVERITGLSYRRVREAARAGHLTMHEPPAGVRGRILYSRASAEALARRMTHPATIVGSTEGDRPHG